jgi:hypothetical protein
MVRRIGPTFLTFRQFPTKNDNHNPYANPPLRGLVEGERINHERTATRDHQGS